MFSILVGILSPMRNEDNFHTPTGIQRLRPHKVASFLDFAIATTMLVIGILAIAHAPMAFTIGTTLKWTLIGGGALTLTLLAQTKIPKTHYILR